MELSEQKAKFDALGVSIAAMSYDSADTNSSFAGKHSISFPLLSDERAVHATEFGVLNESYPKGHRAYGVPHPGVFLVNGKGDVFAKFAEKDYRKRPAIELILDAIKSMAGN